MAFKKTLPQRIFSAYKFTAPSLTTCSWRISSSSMLLAPVSPNPDNNKPHDPGDDGGFRRFLHQSLATSPKFRSLPSGEKLREKLRGMDVTKDRIKLVGLLPPKPQCELKQLRVADARKLLRLSQLEMIKSRLRKIQKSWIYCSEFLQICNKTCSNNADQGLEFAKMLDESGDVIVLGNVVFLRPEQVVKAMQELMPMPITNSIDTQMFNELQQMEEQKAAIDKKAESLVRKELWCGLSCLVIQTTAFIRLTFWDLTWDVMEPICFYVTTIYCMAGYAFFLRTYKEPTFEGFFKARFSTKQKQLMKLHNFDHQRYNDLKGAACYRHSSLAHV